ncbi:MAG: lipoprotein insertase outer membrane protein LolB [Rhodanobacter sp.]|jgi:outer membrane lipoprotein LolB|nr:lipoprotein insertase outer membrane protein LolB [Rhodanobacter sp.]
MMMIRAARFAPLLAALLLSACVVTTPTKKPSPEPVADDTLERQSAREAQLAMHAAWGLQGRLAVSDAHDSGSGSLEWLQEGSAFRFSVHAPVTGKTWVLTGDAERVRLEGLRKRPINGNDAAQLLERELGWHVPVVQLASWVRGARAPGDARVSFRDDGLPAQIDQDGWSVQYLDYDTSTDPALPNKVFASKGDTKVRLTIREWALQ